MKLKHAYEGIDRSEKNRKLMKKTGRTLFGQKIWTQAEDDKVIKFYPDIKLLRRHLKGRSESAIKARAGKLGVRRKHTLWTGFEVARLRKLRHTASWQEILIAFPKFTATQIKYCMKFHGIKCPRKKFRPTKWPILNSIRDKAHSQNLSMGDLDYFAGTGRYFQDAQWSSGNKPNPVAVAKAVHVLGGTLVVQWSD